MVGIDRSDEVLERAKALAARRHVENVEWKKGDLSRLPLRDDSVDVAMLSQALHHASDPERALAETARVLRPGGRLLILDLREHDQAWVRNRFGDRHPRLLDRRAGDACCTGARIERNVRARTSGASKPGDPFAVLIASGVKTTSARPTVHTHKLKSKRYA